jgi:putative transposase
VNGAYHEIQQPSNRYAVIDLQEVVALCGFSKLVDFQQAHRQWVETALHSDLAVRVARWSEAVAVGSRRFVEKIQTELGPKALNREPILYACGSGKINFDEISRRY